MCDVEIGCRVVIQASKLELRIMRYELTDFEWAAIGPMLPNKPHGVFRRYWRWEVPLPWRPTANRSGTASADPTHER